jgi:hypothetical protein
MEKTRKNRVVRATYGAIHSLGSVVGVSWGLAKSVGRFIWAGSKILPRPSRAGKRPTRQKKSSWTREKIRSIVIDELTRLAAGDAELTGAKLEERLQVMAETILGLQEKINELSARGPVSETDMWEAMGSLKAAESLTDDERAILVTVFKQNIAIQRPDLIDTPVVQNSLTLKG